ncbi:MAG TPA: cyclic pyranopterin monophosphate synthase MoaC [bacterium]|nr:cyclic pyranopterin monophosphate synthase MoaC [bacterium]HPJ71409.1 cyclic pyranopterin monophosphate synthase MoaC [bacterium]HPQ65914.1 cyclic pyranopterin monophosphate synthase MoaC [bacterium]
MTSEDFSHLDGRGRARMVDVTGKDPVVRTAVAAGSVAVAPATLELAAGKGLGKGDLFAVARVAGIQAAKRTAEIIPLCHQLPLTRIKVEVEPDPLRSRIRISAEVTAVARTGVEMEALTAVAAAALTVYDMAKAVDKGMIIEKIRLVSKHKEERE